ncbi:hypothetical protein [Streptomyces sp. NPDC021562]|uniref:hypothetical protein n=1 Tax=Streptomyces sp. NPDC021562 TaxID=3155121 RepID=UPI00340B3590
MIRAGARLQIERSLIAAGLITRAQAAEEVPSDIAPATLARGVWAHSSAFSTCPMSCTSEWTSPPTTPNCATSSVDKPSHRPGRVAVEALQQIDDSLPRGYLAGDRAYNDQKPENFQLPIRATSYEPVYDYAKGQLGVQAGFAGAELVEGNWYCPSMPEELKEATKDLINEKIDKQTWINRIRARAAYLFMPKQRPDAEGHRRVMRPAEANRTQCPLKAYTLGRGIHLPLVDPTPSPAGQSEPPRRHRNTAWPEP